MTKLSYQTFLESMDKLESVFRRQGGFTGHAAYYEAVAPAFTDATWTAAVAQWLNSGERFPLPADLLRGRTATYAKDRHVCGDCEGHAGWVYEREAERSVMAPCPGRRDVKAMSFYARRRANLGPGVS